MSVLSSWLAAKVAAKASAKVGGYVAGVYINTTAIGGGLYYGAKAAKETYDGHRDSLVKDPTMSQSASIVGDVALGGAFGTICGAVKTPLGFPLFAYHKVRKSFEQKCVGYGDDTKLKSDIESAAARKRVAEKSASSLTR